MKSIDEITHALCQPEGSWDSVSECLEAIKQNPVAFKQQLSDPQNLLQLFNPDTLRQHQIYVPDPNDYYRIESPGPYVFVGGHVTQNHPEAEGWFFGNAKAAIEQGKGHSYDRSRMILWNSHTAGDCHDHATAISDGEYVHLQAYDQTKVEFLRSGNLDLFGDASAKVTGRSATVTTHDHTHLIATDTFRIIAQDESFVEAHDDCRIQMEGKAACVAYGETKIEAHGKNRIWMMDDNCRPMIGYPETIFCKAYEAPEFRQAIHEALRVDRPLPDLINRLNDLTVAYGPAINENWEWGSDAWWLAECKIDRDGKYVNLAENRSEYENIYPTPEKYGNLDLQVQVLDEYCESSAMLTHLLEKRGFLMDYDPHYGSFGVFRHWGNAQLFNETVRYEEAVLHKLRPAVKLHDNPQKEIQRMKSGQRGL